MGLSYAESTVEIESMWKLLFRLPPEQASDDVRVLELDILYIRPEQPKGFSLTRKIGVGHVALEARLRKMRRRDKARLERRKIYGLPGTFAEGFSGQVQDGVFGRAFKLTKASMDSSHVRLACTRAILTSTLN